MQIVFVHGVFVRDEAGSDAYGRGVAARHQSFSDYCLEGAPATFYDPYWGRYGASPGQGWASIPRGPGVALGLGDAGGIGGGASLAPDGASLAGNALLKAARADFGGVLNSLSLTLAADPGAEPRRLALEIGRYAARLDAGGAKLDAPPWLLDPGLRTDEDFLARLEEEVAPPGPDATLGFRNFLRNAGRLVVGAAVDIVDGPVEKLVRRFTPQIATFLGDVFVYLRDEEPRKEIRAEVVRDLVRAGRAAAEGGGPLVVVGHSMGGIILFDLLTDAEAVRQISDAIGAPLDIDLLLTVGTQIGLFEEIGLFAGAGRETSARPPAVRRWWHVYNVMDVLSFAVEGVIAGAEQFSVDTRANIVEAHTAYFDSPVFHQRLRKRMIAAGLLA